MSYSLGCRRWKALFLASLLGRLLNVESFPLPIFESAAYMPQFPNLYLPTTITLNMQPPLAELEHSLEEGANFKRLILIRHGCTWMNEYLAKPGSEWGDPHFTDIFERQEEYELYRDSPLSKKGLNQAQDLMEFLKSTEEGQKMIKDIELIAVSPLTRALQTVEHGILPSLIQSPDKEPLVESDASCESSVPIVALPLATERVYLISDYGLPVSELSMRFSFANFDNEFDNVDSEKWWFTVQNEDTMEEKRNVHAFNKMHPSQYVEWRPSSEGQRYAKPGEPDKEFEARMMALLEWIDDQEQNVICLVCHWGVIKWLVDEEFKNCEVQEFSLTKQESRWQRTTKLTNN